MSIFIDNIERRTEQNTQLHEPIFQEHPRLGGRLEIHVNSIATEIPRETHTTMTQFIRVEQGYGWIDMRSPSGNVSIEKSIGPGDAVIIPAGYSHRIRNGDGPGNPLKIYSIYAKDSTTVNWEH